MGQSETNENAVIEFVEASAASPAVSRASAIRGGPDHHARCARLWLEAPVMTYPPVSLRSS